MSEFIVSAKMVADAGQMIGEIDRAEAAMGRLVQSAGQRGETEARAGADTARAAASQREHNQALLSAAEIHQRVENVVRKLNAEYGSAGDSARQLASIQLAGNQEVARSEALLEQHLRAATEAGIARAQMFSGVSDGVRKASGDTGAFIDAVERLRATTEPATRSEEAFSQALAAVRSEADAAGIGTSLLTRVVADAERRMAGSAQAAAELARQAAPAAQAQRGVAEALGAAGEAGNAFAVSVGDVDQQTAAAVNSIGAFARAIGGLGNDVGGAESRTGSLALLLRRALPFAISAAVGAVVSLTTALTDNEQTLDRTRTAADALGEAQSAMARMFDFSTGKIKENTAELRLNIMMGAMRMQQEAREQRQQGLLTLGGLDSSWGTVAYDALRAPLGGAPVAQIQAAQQRAYVQQIMRQVQAGVVDPASAALALSRADTSRLNLSGMEIAEAGNRVIQSREMERIAQDTINSLTSGQLADRFRTDPRDERGTGKPSERGGGGGRPRRPTDQTEFGEDAGRRIANLVGRFAGEPRMVESVRRALSELDDVMSDIERRQPPNFELLLEAARQARPVIEDGLNRPFDDLIESQERQLRLMSLSHQGREDEAEALQLIWRLENDVGTLREGQPEAILANVRAIEDQARATELLREQQQLQLDVLHETRRAMTDTVTGVLGGDMRALTDLPRRMLDAFNQMTAERVIESLFGEAFRAMEDEITGRNQVREANQRLARTSDGTARAIARLGDAAEGAATGVATTAGADSVEEDIVITASRSIGANPRVFFQRMIEGLLQGIIGEEFARLISAGVARGLEGAAIGGMTGGMLNMLGIRTSGTGSQLGGAAGNIVGDKFLGGLGKMLGMGGGPLGSILGGLAGGLLGGLFTSTKRGTATITNIHDDVSATGNSASHRGAASAMGGSLQDSISRIAEALGGGVGGFAVSITAKKDSFWVDPSGQGQSKKKRGAVEFKDEASALAFALADAIKDGAITGLSAAVQAALRSSTNADRALREALKVDEVETLLKGMGGQLEKQFRDFERQAAERVRIARQYGFDLVKLEEINAKERAALFDQVLASRVGALRDLLDDMNFGDLFEGSIAQRRDRLLGELDKAIADAEAGVEGAAERQAQLSRDLLGLSREAFGTAGGEFAADLDKARSNAERVIELENERVKAAADASRETNNHLNEVNARLSEHTSILRGIAGGIAGLASATPAFGGGGFHDTARFADLL